MAGKGRRDNSDGINIGARSFLIAIGIIFILMVATYVLTLVIPGGEYARIVDESGHTVIDTDAGFHYVEGGIPVWKWLCFHRFWCLGRRAPAPSLPYSYSCLS